MENRKVKKENELASVAVSEADIKNYLCPLATEKEIFMALGVIKSLNLNPLTREVHLIKYSQNEKINIIVGYEVYLKRAERSGKLDGWECGISEDGKTAWVTINRKDWKTPFKWEVNLAEFNKGQATWKQIPSFMGKKVAIAQAFRLAFPDELGGMPYTKEEFDVYDIDADKPTNGKPKVAMPQETKPERTQAPEDKQEQPKENAEPKSTEKQQKAIHTLASKIWGKDETELYKLLVEIYKVEGTAELTNKQASELIEVLQKRTNGK